MIATTRTPHGLQKIDVTQLLQALSEFKKAAAKHRGDKKYTPRDEHQYTDHSHLTARNLEAEGLIDHSAHTLTCKPIPQCGECQGGYIITRPSEDSSPNAKICRRCEVPRQWTERLNKLELPSDAIGMSLDVYEPDSPRQVELINQTMQYLQRGSDGAPPCTLFYGPPGNGKTSILYALAREACQHHWKVKYTSHTQIMSQIQNSWNDRSKRNPLDGWLDDVQVLLLDEFCGIGGSAHKQGWWVKQTVEIIEQIQRKWRAGELAVIMTTNVYPQQMFKMFESNPAFRSRILGMFEPCEMVGRDRRVDNVDLSKWGL